MDLVNSPEAVARNADMVTINGALVVDLAGQVVADSIGGAQFSGIGGHEDFIAASGIELSDRSLVCLPSTFVRDGVVASRIVGQLPERDDRHHAAPPARRRGHRARRGRAARA